MHMLICPFVPTFVQLFLNSVLSTSYMCYQVPTHIRFKEHFLDFTVPQIDNNVWWPPIIAHFDIASC